MRYIQNNLQNLTFNSAIEKIQRLTFTCLVACLFINTFYVIDSTYSYFSGEKKDFTIIFFYLSDFFLLSFIASTIVFEAQNKKRQLNERQKPKSLLIPLLTLLAITPLSFILNFNKLIIPALSIYYLLLLNKAIVLHGTILCTKQSLHRIFEKVFLIAVTCESLLAIYQFSQQSNIGLTILGEPNLSPYNWGIAKVEALGQVFIRTYGTFQHPNILAAFLVLGIMVFLKKLADTRQSSKHITYYLNFSGLALSLTALILTFSRAAWLALIVTLLTYGAFYVALGYRRQRRFIISILLIIGYISAILIILWPLIQQRGNIFDKAYTERKDYSKAGIIMLKKNPIFGIGPAHSLLHMERYLRKSAEPWEIQPIHNYYLAISAEFGIITIAIFIAYIAKAMAKSFNCMRISKHQNAPSIFWYSAGLSAILILMFFDHYFYTIQATSLLLWIWLALTYKHVTHETNE